MPPPIHGAAVIGKNIFESKLINSEFDCIYINLSASNEVSEIGKLGIKKIIFLLSNLLNIIKTVLKEHPQLCYVTPSSWDWGFYRDFLTIGVLKLLNRKIVVHFHNKGVEQWANRPFNKMLYRCFFSNLKVIILAEELYEEKQKYVKKEDVFICPNGINQSKVKTNSIKLKNDCFSLLFLSNMMEEKGVWVLLEACQILKEKGYVFCCNFVGKWSDVNEKTFNDRVNSFGLKKMVFAHGSKYGDKKNVFFEEANAFVFPTYYHGECFSLVLLEAMEYGLPCISTFEGGIPSVIINGETGILVDQKDSISLAKNLIFLIENPVLCNKMGIAGRERFLKYFTLEIFENRFTEILKKCI